MNIRLDHLFFNRKEKNILTDLDLTIPDKKITAVLGSNGSGKSTLLKIIAGLLKPAAGQVLYGEQNIAAASPAALARKRAILLQNPDVPSSMTVHELLKLSRYAFDSGKTADKNAIDTALHDTGTARWLDRQLCTLSGGELRKVFLAMTLAQEPELLLLDEVEAGLDAAFRSAFPAMLKKWQRDRELTVVMVMHDFDLALQCADHVLALEEGKVTLFSAVNEPDFPEKLHRTAGKNFRFHREDDTLRALLDFSAN